MNDDHHAAAGFGPIGMRVRVALVGGVFRVESSPGHGARIAARAPTGRPRSELTVQAG